MRVNKKEGWVFVSLPKACTNTMYRVLKEHYGPLVRIGTHPHVVPIEYEKYFIWTVCRSPFTRAVSQWWSSVGSGLGVGEELRAKNSRQRIPKPLRKVRYYFPSLPRFMPFEDFVEWLTKPERQNFPGFQRHFVNSQTYRLRSFKPARVLPVESLKEEFKTLPFYNGEPKEWPRINTAESKQVKAKLPPYSELFTQEIADRIIAYDPVPFEKGWYDRDSWKGL